MGAISVTSDGKERVNNWGTPPWFFEAVQKRHGITFGLDAMAESHNALCSIFLRDAFDLPWSAPHVWCNPPDILHLAAVKCAINCAVAGDFQTAALLVRCGPETEAWAVASAHSWRTEIITPRLNYVDPTSGKERSGISKHSTLFLMSPDSAREPVVGNRRVIELVEYRRPGSGE